MNFDDEQEQAMERLQQEIESLLQRPYKYQPLFLKERCEVWINEVTGQQFVLNLN